MLGCAAPSRYYDEVIPRRLPHWNAARCAGHGGIGLDNIIL